jgi:CRISPR-associated endonuclease/helicase Cas3
MKGPQHLPNFPSPPLLELDQCLAKTRSDTYGNPTRGVNVVTHCQIVGEVARELVTRQPEWLRSTLFPPGSELVAAAHDIGKVCPTFQKKIHDAVNEPIAGFDNVNPALEEIWGYHAGVSQAATEGIGPFIPEILGRHHGSNPTLGLYNANHEAFGGVQWQKLREELLEVLKEKLASDWPSVTNEIQATVLSGLTTVADWVGSGSIFDQPPTDWASMVSQALDNAGFITPRIRPDLSFHDIFNFDPYPVQNRFIEACHGAGVYVLEAPMGLGKTEAALFSAYRALESGRATGIYFALPTQLTSNKIFERMKLFLEKILDADQPMRCPLLVHGNAHLLEDFELGEEGKPGGSWFKSIKRGLLAPFAVGTVDQALMAVMNVKHGFVRTFGLAGKVVILDEVHSYDSYTGTLLDNLVKALVEIHCTVVILSATLTRDRRAVFLGGHPLENTPDAYPLVSARPRDETVRWIETEPQDSVEVALRVIADDKLAVLEALDRAATGQQVLWVENTVIEAQERYKTLAAQASDRGVQCGLLHSRFLKVDRQNNEKLWVNFYGLEGQSTRQAHGRILVGTQVVEQSLDIDADFLVTRLCPTDMLLQRMGRLWRHKNSRPACARREAWILSLPYKQVLVQPDVELGKSAFVYSPYVLLRTLKVWEPLASVQIPGQIRALLERTYEETTEVGVLVRLKKDLEEQKMKLRGLALVGLSQGGVTLPEKVATRYSEFDTIEVLLLKRLRWEADDAVVTFTDGQELKLPRRPWAKGLPEWRKASVALLMHTVTVSARTAPEPLPEKTLGWLKPYVFLDDSFRVALVQNDGTVIPIQEGPFKAHQQLATYDSRIGYQTHKEEWT